MCFYSSILLSYIVRYKQRKPFAHQVQLFTWWPNALRPKSQKKGLNGTTQQGIPMKGVQGSKLHDRSDSVDDTPIDSSSASNALVWTPKEQKKAETMLWVCVGATTLIFIRSIYRSIELLDGWSGPIIENQGLFDALDGALMVSLIVVAGEIASDGMGLMALGWFASSSSVSPSTCSTPGGGSPRCKNAERN